MQTRKPEPLSGLKISTKTETSADPISCRCGSYEFALTRNTFKNGTHHVAAACYQCGSFLQFIPQSRFYADGPTIDVMPFGKHKGKKLSELPGEYLAWMAENMESAKFRELAKNEMKRRA